MAEYGFDDNSSRNLKGRIMSVDEISLIRYMKMMFAFWTGIRFYVEKPILESSLRRRNLFSTVRAFSHPKNPSSNCSIVMKIIKICWHKKRLQQKMSRKFLGVLLENSNEALLFSHLEIPFL